MGSNAPPGRTCRSSTRKVRRARPFAAPPRPRPPYMSWGEFCPPVCAPARPRARSAACGGPAVAIVGPHRSLSEPPKAAGEVCRYLGQFLSFSLVVSSRCWHSGSSRRRDAREGDRGHTGAATAPPVASGQSLSGRAGPQKIHLEVVDSHGPRARPFATPPRPRPGVRSLDARAARRCASPRALPRIVPPSAAAEATLGTTGAGGGRFTISRLFLAESTPFFFEKPSPC